jgi:hypothetical protein
VAQGIGPEFKPTYHKKKEREKGCWLSPKKQKGGSYNNTQTTQVKFTLVAVAPFWFYF